MISRESLLSAYSGRKGLPPVLHLYFSQYLQLESLLCLSAFHSNSIFLSDSIFVFFPLPPHFLLLYPIHTHATTLSCAHHDCTRAC